MSLTRRASLVLAIAVIALGFSLPFYMSGFRLFQYTQVCIYAIALMGLNLLTGYNGQFSLGHGAFYAVGAYISAIMMDRWNINYAWTIPVAGLLCLIVGNDKVDPGGLHRGIDGYGLEIVERVPLQTVPTDENIAYLRAKQSKLGHILGIEDQELGGA